MSALGPGWRPESASAVPTLPDDKTPALGQGRPGNRPPLRDLLSRIRLRVRRVWQMAGRFTLNQRPLMSGAEPGDRP